MANITDTNGAADVEAECRKWQTRCAELTAERDRLRRELTEKQAECDLYRNSLFHLKCKDYQPDVDEAVGFAHMDDKPTIHELIAELESAPEK